MSQVQSIKCTNCAAPLKLLGGGRVESITCAYCKSVLDLNDNYKVLSNFKNVRDKHKLPFEVGMRGKLKGIKYTIIGRISYVDTIDVEYSWSDFLLFSPLYGYAWLSYDNGHVVYSKRNRTFPNIMWEEIANQSLMTLDGNDYTPYESYIAKVTYVEGELTWIAKYGDKVEYIDLISPPLGLTVENSGKEIEFYNDEYMNATEVYDAFEVPKEQREEDESFHPLKPFSKPFFKELSMASFWSIWFIVAIVFFMMFDGSGKRLLFSSATNISSTTESFTLNSTNYLTSIHIEANSAKALNNFNIKLLKDEKLLFSLTQNSAYILDKETAKVSKRLETWKKRAKEVVVYLDLKEVGLYQLSFVPIDATVNSVLNIEIKEKSSRLNYLLIFIGVLICFFLLYYFFIWRYKRKIANEKEIDNEEESSTDINDWAHTIVWIVAILFMIFLGED